MNDMAIGCVSAPPEPKREPTIADYSAKLHITLIETRSAIGYIMRNVLGSDIPDLSPVQSNCYISALEYDVALAHEIMIMAKELADRIGGEE